jgi:polyisoprenoid-binding protein YceI
LTQPSPYNLTIHQTTNHQTKPINMKTTVLTTAAALVTATVADAQTWAFDKSHSKVQFAVTHLVISETVGQFAEWDGTVTATKEDFTDAQINFTIKVSSINTDNTDRDNHLRSADFFDVEKFPEMTFKSRSMKKVDGKRYKLVGDLTMHGVTRPIDLDVTFNGTAKSPWGQTVAGFKLSGNLNRTDYGLKWNKTLEAGGLLVSEEVNISAAVELVKK